MIILCVLTFCLRQIQPFSNGFGVGRHLAPSITESAPKPPKTDFASLQPVENQQVYLGKSQKKSCRRGLIVQNVIFFE